MRAKKIQGWYEWRNIVFNPSYDNHIHTTSIVRSTKSLHRILNVASWPERKASAPIGLLFSSLRSHTLAGKVGKDIQNYANYEIFNFKTSTLKISPRENFKKFGSMEPNF
jgi:hypothetical protein